MSLNDWKEAMSVKLGVGVDCTGVKGHFNRVQVPVMLWEVELVDKTSKSENW
jgi:hypothetical protein